MNLDDSINSINNSLSAAATGFTKMQYALLGFCFIVTISIGFIAYSLFKK